ncbi:MAG: ATP-binding protein [Actinomycetota bacterium]|nr:ATP-binding protein [Actinomycetota bacterium]
MADIQAVEQRASILRAAVAVLAGVSAATAGAGVAAVALLLVTLVGAGALWTGAARFSDDLRLRRLGACAWVLDALALGGFAALLQGEGIPSAGALLVLVALEGGLRYGLRGAAVGSAVVSVAALLTGGGLSAVLVTVAAAGAAGVTVAEASSRWRARVEVEAAHSRRLLEIDNLKDRFLAITSHEIRGPLTAIITGIDTVWRRGNRLSEAQRTNLLEMVSGQAHQMARLVEDLMITSHLQAGNLQLKPKWTELRTVVTQALDSAASKRRSHNLAVFIEPIRAEIDASRLDQVVRNLVENAYKYTPEKTSVAVEVKRARQGMVLQISDEGPGIPDDKRSALFDAFSRIEQTRTGQEGVGLGLFVVSQIVSAMGGHIDLASSPHGTTFTISIPCRAETSARESADLEFDGEAHDQGPAKPSSPTHN